MGEYYLKHHGIKGMRWGVRRYQNPDGTLTDEGKEHYAKPNNRPVKKIVRKFQNSDGTLTSLGKEVYKQRLESLPEDDWYAPFSDSKQDRALAEKIDKTGVIPKGTTLYRQTQEPEEIGHDRKYATLSLDASLDYSNGDMLVGTIGKNPRSYVYKTTRPLKIATDKEVEDFIFSQHPKEEKHLRALRDGRDYVYQNLDRRLNTGNTLRKGDSIDHLATSYKDKVDSFMHKYYRKSWADEDLLGPNRTELYKNPSSIHKHFKELGYDAVSDIEDGGLKNGSMYSIILLDPKGSIKTEKDMPTSDFWQYWKDNKYE